ncbi:glycoside hydrolase family 2, partial [candidate division KSB1 bacterium]|nr:glycoside hydrolase family 2 [candidate division KSB1 bacterium]
MKKLLFFLMIFVLFCLLTCSHQSIPLPEHPRPDFQRENWLNLNGRWKFEFDKENTGLEKKWFNHPEKFQKNITVPFPWGSKLSGVEDEADIGWYARTINVPKAWNGQRIFAVIGACDWHTTAWLDGNELGTNQGGYTPFEFELTALVNPGREHQLVLRVDDTPHDYKLEGKQGYGRAAGIWQTVYLEARPQVALQYVHFTPDIDAEKVHVAVQLDQNPPDGCTISVKSGELSAEYKVENDRVEFDIPIP